MPKRMSYGTSGARRRQCGVTLVEVVVVMAVVALMAAGFSQLIAENGTAMRSKAVAMRLDAVTEAARGYVDAHFTDLILAADADAPIVIPTGRASAGDPVPSGLGGLPSLQGGGFLPQSFIDVNAYGQQHAVLVREPTAGMLEVMVTTYGGREIPDGELGRVAGLVGARAGFMASNPIGGTAGQVTGLNGGWRTAASDWLAGQASPAPGRVMSTLAFDDGTEVSDWLARFDVGVPEANTMHTTINMNGNDLDNVTTIRGAAAILRIEDDLEVEQDIAAGRNIAATGLVEAGTDVVAGNDISAGTDISADNDVLAARDVAAGRDADVANDVRAGNDVVADRRVVGDGGVLPNMVVAEGGACSPNGLLGRESSGRTLTCESGTWQGSGNGGQYLDGWPNAITGCNNMIWDMARIDGWVWYAARQFSCKSCSSKWARWNRSNGAFSASAGRGNIENRCRVNMSVLIARGQALGM